MNLYCKLGIALASLFVTCFFVQSTSASDAYLKIDNNEFGQGVFRQRGRECLVIAPTHVVENAFKIDITTEEKKNYSAEMLESFPGDISVLRFVNEDALICRSVTWSGRANVNALLEIEKQGELRTMLADGSIRITAVDIVGYDKYRNINVRPRNQEDAIAKGASGSPLFIAGQFSGILLSVKKDVGNVIRLDALTNTLSLFFGDTLQSGRQGPMTIQVSNAKKSNVSAPGKGGSDELEFSGVIAKSAVVTHTMKLGGNSPVRINFSTTGDAEKFSFEIWDSARKIVYRNPSKQYSGTESFSVPFTPPENDTYSMHITGTEGEGKYKFKISPIVSDAQLRSEENILQFGGNAVTGIIAQGAVAVYRVNLEENSPIRLNFFSTGDQGKYAVEMVNSTGKSVYRNAAVQYSGTETFSLPFTPPASDVYLLNIKGTEGEGKYKFKIGMIASNAQLRGEANVLQVGGNPVEGVIAQGAVAEYRLKVEANAPIRLNFLATGDSGKYKAEILDSTGKAVYLDPHRRYSGTETVTIPFATSKSELYFVRIIGAEGECRYTLNATRTVEK